MEQKPSGPERVDIESVALLVRSDVHSGHDKLALAGYLSIALLDADTAFPDRLDLCSGKYDTSLITLFDKIVMKSLLVIRDDFAAAFTHQNVRILLNGNNLSTTLPLIWSDLTHPTS